MPQLRVLSAASLSEVASSLRRAGGSSTMRRITFVSAKKSAGEKAQERPHKWHFARENSHSNLPQADLTVGNVGRISTRLHTEKNVHGWLAVGPVRREPFSTAISLLTGKLTGNLAVPRHKPSNKRREVTGTTQFSSKRARSGIGNLEFKNSECSERKQGKREK